MRLHGIDAPERGQDFHRVSKDYLTALVMHQSVRVIGHNRDRYGRTVGIVIRRDSVVNELMLQSGLAWHYLAYDKNEKWSRLEATARHEKRGLWSLPNPVAPWEFRRQKKMKHKLN